MKEFKLFRNLPFSKWHQRYERYPERSSIMRYRDKCLCPYSEHKSTRCLDVYDPLNLKQILELKEDDCILIFAGDHADERIGYYKLKKIKFHSDHIQLYFKMDSLEMKLCFRHSEQLSRIKYIAVIESNDNPFIPLEVTGGQSVYMRILSYLTGKNLEEVIETLEKLDETPIPKNLEIKSSDYDHL